MDFEWNEQQADLHAQTLRFSRSLSRGARRRDRDRVFAEEQWRACGDFGLTGLCVGAEYGGMGLNALTTARVMEAFGEGCEDMGLVFAVAAHLFACAQPIADHGNDTLKQKYLPGLASGSLVGANAITEERAGSDAFALSATATKSGRSYRINGTKSYVTNAPQSDVMLVYASTEPKYGHLGISAFVVERQTPGITVGEPFAKIGLSTAHTSSVYFDDVQVPDTARLGNEGAGASIFSESMAWERSALFAAYTGLSARTLATAVEHAKARKQFRKKIGAFQAISHKLADMALSLDSARLLLYRACWLKDKGRRAASEVAMGKLAASESAVQIALGAIQVLGGSGVVAEFNVERALRDAIPSTLFSGTSEIQRNLIATELGL